MLFLLSLYNSSPHTQPALCDKDITDIANGDREALKKLYSAVYRSVYGFALSITKNTHDAEDVLQETVLSVYEKSDSYTPQGKPMAWIFTIARNHALSKLREHSRKSGLNENSDLDDDAFMTVDDADSRIVLKAALSVLDDEERQIVMLHATAGMKNREIAEALQIPLGTVLSKYHRAIKKLRQHLETVEEST